MCFCFTSMPRRSFSGELYERGRGELGETFEIDVHIFKAFGVIVSEVVKMIASVLSVLDAEEHRNELAEFYAEHKNALYAFALSRTLNRERAEDAVQEAFLRIAKYPERFFALPVHKRMSYAVIVTRNAVNDILGESARSSELPEIIEDNSISVEDMALGNVSAEELKAFVNEMPEAQRQAIILKIVHEMTTAEIANALNISEPTARKRVSNAYKTIRKYLNGG